MEIKLKPGKYVVAVSGGIDSVALLDLLKNLSDVELVVAHFDHGIREDSHLDRQLVQKLAKQYDLPFAYEEGKLGPKVSEATARAERYKFLDRVKNVKRAEAIVTAHHQDDLLETAILNMLRGTGRKGLTSLKSRPGIIRPLLGLSKKDLLDYARKQKLAWREDATNLDTNYSRNYIRHEIMPRIPEPEKHKLLSEIKNLGRLNEEIDNLLDATLTKAELDRQRFIGLPHSVAKETMAAWLRANSVTIDARKLNKLTLEAKTLAPGKKLDVDKNVKLLIEKQTLNLYNRNLYER